MFKTKGGLNLIFCKCGALVTDQNMQKHLATKLHIRKMRFNGISTANFPFNERLKSYEVESDDE